MNKHPLTGDSDSTFLDANATQEHVSPTQNGASDSTDPEQSATSEMGGDDVNHATLLEEKRRAVTEAKKRFHEKEQARAEADYLKVVNTTLKNPSSILEVAEKSTQLAEQIAQENWGKSLAEVRQILAQEKESPAESTGSAEEVRRIFQEERERELRAHEAQKIDKLETEFFLDKDIDPTGPMYKQIMSTYYKFKPSSLEDAKEILEMAYAKHRSIKTSPNDIDAVYMPRTSTGSATQGKKGPSAKVIELGKKLGLTDKYLK